MVGKYRKLISVAACIAVTASLFTGCGSSSENTAGKQSTTAGTTAKEQTSAGTEKKSLLPYTGDPVVYKGLAFDTQSLQYADRDNPITKAYKESTGNVKIEWDQVPSQDYEQKTKLLLNSGDIPDVMWLGDPIKNAAQYGQNGLFLDFQKYIDYMPNTQKNIEKYPWIDMALNEKGQRLFMQEILTEDTAFMYFYYNKQLLEKYGIAVPQTIDELTAAMVKLRQSDPKITPFVTFGGINSVLEAFMNIFHTSNTKTYNKETKKWEFNPVSDPNYKKFIGYMADAYSKKCFHPEVVTMSGEQEKELIKQGNWGFMYIWVCSPSLEVWLDEKPTVDYRFMPPPSFNGKSSIGSVYIKDGPPGMSFFASAKAKNPELLASYIDNIFSEKTSELKYWGVEGYSFIKNADGTKSYVPAINEGKSKTANEMGVQQLTDPRFCALQDRYSERLLFYNENELEAHKLLVDCFNSGKVIPVYGQPEPALTQEENDTISAVFNPINTFIKEEQLKFITGHNKMNDFDSYVQKIKEMGDINKALDIFNGKKQYELGERLFKY